MQMKYGLWILCLGVSVGIQAQQNNDSLQIKQVEVVKAFEAIIATVSKIHIKPHEARIERQLPAYKYTITNQPITVADPIPVIKPLAMDVDAPFKVNSGYVRAAYGYRKNPDIEAGYHIMQKDAYNAGVRAHYTSLDNTANQPLQKYRMMGIALYGQTLVAENMQLFGNVNSDFQRRYFYHTSILSDSVQSMALDRQRNELGFAAGIRNAEETKSGIHYESRIGVKQLTFIAEDLSEWNFSVTGKIQKEFGSKFLFKTEAFMDHTRLKTETNVSQFILQVTPSIKASFRKFSSQVGVQYLNSGNGTSNIFPVLAIKVPIKAPYLVLTGDVSQGNYANTMGNASLINPFIQNMADSLVNSVNRSISLGINGTSSMMSYKICIGRQTLKNQMFFISNPTDIRKFSMIYDSGSLWYITGSFENKINEQSLIGGRFEGNRYSLENLQHAWHVPRFVGSLYTVRTLIEEKLSLRGDFNYSSFSYYTDAAKNIRKTNALMDLSMSVSYKFGEKIALQASLMNILNNKFERWYGYPTIGTNASVGCKVIF